MQLRHLAERQAHRYNRILKSRQFGFTTLYCIDYLDEALWISGMSCAIIAHEQKFNDKIFAIVKRAYESLPEQLRPKTRTNTKYEYNFITRFDGVPLDSSIYVSTDVRSGTVRKLHITEAAWIKDWEKIAAGAKQAVPKDGSITEETTANGFNVFFDGYEESQNKAQMNQLTDYDYKPYFYPWFLNPEYTLPGTFPEIQPGDKIKYGDEALERKRYNLTDGQLLWRRWKINELKTSKSEDGATITLSGLQLFRQEYPANPQEAFQSGAGNIFDVSDYKPTDPLTRQQAEDQIKQYPYPHETISAMMAEFDALTLLGVIFWEMPMPNTEYVMGVDPSGGPGDTGADYSPAEVWNVNHTQAAQLYGKIRADTLAEYVARIATFYNKAYVGVENNMLSCILFLIKIYDNYFTEVKIDKKTQQRTRIIGWTTSSKTRDPMIDEYLALWEDGDLDVKSRLTISEMKTFVKKDGGKREHADGKHDDVLIADMIAQQMIKLRPRKSRTLSDNPLS